MALRDEACLAALTEDVVQTSAIEGETLNVASVRSSVARRLGVDIGAVTLVDRHVDGIVGMVLDATGNATSPLTPERLFGWHAALFPTGYSGISRIRTGQWRDDATGPMQVISGSSGREKVHFEAPPASKLSAETARFLAWLNTTTPTEPALVRADGSPQRFYSFSAQIHRERKAYYNILERTQKGDMDITAWLKWFLAELLKAVEQAHTTVDQVLAKAKFWQRAATVIFRHKRAISFSAFRGHGFFGI
jgi:Fic family protein